MALARNPDPRSLHFGPLGLTGELRPEVSHELFEDDVAWMQLGERVPEAVRSQFEKLKAMYRDGLFRYDGFTAVERDAYRVLEVALRIRFLEHYDFAIPVVEKGEERVETVHTFEEARRLVRRRGVKLKDHRRFNGSLSSLLHWARQVGYFYGQHNRVRESVTTRLRNELTHSEFDYVFMPPDVLRTVGLHFQWIQRLWGYDTPSGTAYPGPVARYLWVAGFGPITGEATWMELDGFAGLTDDERAARTWYVLLAGPHEHLPDWRPGFDSTALPVDVVWGPGSWDDLCDAVASKPASWATDRVDILDRVFYVRTVAGSTDLPRSAAQVISLRERHSAERWAVIRADFPGATTQHLSSYTPGPHAEHGPCRSCSVGVLMFGARRETVERLVRSSAPSGQPDR